MRDDGVEGLSAIRRSGGFTVVQDPANAPYPGMPQAVLAHMPVDYKVNTLEMGLVLSDLVFRPAHPGAVIPQDVLNEANIAERVLTSINSVEEIAEHTPYTCPSCGGVLFDVNHNNEMHSYRCHAGHAFSPDSLFHFKSAEVEEALWASLRFLEEQKRMLQKLPINRTQLGLDKPTTINKRIAENQRYIDQLRAMLLGNENGNGGGQENGQHA
jgi:two-component system chemotaxis response regulator CheB